MSGPLTWNGVYSDGINHRQLGKALREELARKKYWQNISFKQSPGFLLGWDRGYKPRGLLLTT